MNDDLISMGAALEALDQIKYALWEIDIPSPGNVPEYIEHHEGVQRVMKRIDELREKMEQLPTTEIVRCKDCKWFGEIGCAIHVVDDTDKPTENDYCSFAERRSDG